MSPWIRRYILFHGKRHPADMGAAELTRFLTSLAPAVLDAIKKHARRVFFSSFVVRDDLERQADPVSQFHADIERLIERSGLEWTFLRISGLASRTLGWAPQIRADGIVRWPYGAAARSLLHERDLAAVAVRALTGEGHGSMKYVLTGPQSVSQVEQVRAIGEAIGRPLCYQPRDPARGREAADARRGLAALDRGRRARLLG